MVLMKKWVYNFPLETLIFVFSLTIFFWVWVSEDFAFMLYFCLVYSQDGLRFLQKTKQKKKQYK